MAESPIFTDCVDVGRLRTPLLRCCILAGKKYPLLSDLATRTQGLPLSAIVLPRLACASHLSKTTLSV